MGKPGLTLEQISERSGVEPRTLRSWVSEGLLSPPYRAGRGATYPAANASRALAVRALKDVHGLSLAEIRRRFMVGTEEQIEDWALEAGEALTAPGTARDYIRMVRAREGAGKAATAGPRERYLAGAPAREGADEAAAARTQSYPSAPASRVRHSAPAPTDDAATRKVDPSRRRAEQTEDLAVLEDLVLQLEYLYKTQAPRRSRGAIWTRISVTPDLELSIRGDLEPRERVLFERLADHLRAFLTGRSRI